MLPGLRPSTRMLKRMIPFPFRALMVVSSFHLPQFPPRLQLQPPRRGMSVSTPALVPSASLPFPGDPVGSSRNVRPSTRGLSSTREHDSDAVHHTEPNRDNDDNDNDNDNDDDETVRRKTMEWIRRVVVGLRLCPFAAGTVTVTNDATARFQGEASPSSLFRVDVVRGTDPFPIARAVTQCANACRNDDCDTSTGVVIVPDYFPHDFVSFWELVQILQESAVRHHNDDDDDDDNENDDDNEDDDDEPDIQLLPFHPQFQFGDGESDDNNNDAIDHYTNRSPYPMIHVLKDEDVGYASASIGGDASVVWKRNIRLLRQMEAVMGTHAARTILTVETLTIPDESRGTIQTILRDVDNK